MSEVLKGKIGSIGTYEVDVDNTGLVKILVGIEANIADLLVELAKKTENQIDDKVAEAIKAFLSKVQP